MASPAARNFSVLANSYAPASTIAGSLHTCERGPISRLSSAPTANASRYEGIGSGCAKLNSLRVALLLDTPVCFALINATNGASTSTVAE